MNSTFMPPASTGSAFVREFCFRCVRYSHCDVAPLALVHDLDTTAFPRQWLTDDASKPCADFKPRGARRGKSEARLAAEALA